MFQLEQGESFPDRESRVLKLWEKEGTFKKSIEARNGKPLFSFYDGPPFATGLPHYGHLLAGTIKDAVPRYKTMKGFCVPRRFGWDCHGLPVENEIEKGKELSGAAAIESFGIANFNEECRSIVLRYSGEWKKTVDRMGRWVDFDQTYRTMDISFMESVWWVFQKLFDSGLVYEGFKVMPFSMKLGTPISNFEANLNYKDVDDPSATVAFQSLDNPNVYYLAWTTTPWTLPSNLALIVGSKIDYVRVAKDGKEYILAEARLPAIFKEGAEVLEKFTGESLKNKRYKPLFPFFAGHEGAFRILLDDFVTTDDGTGIVHAAPAFGESDFFVCKRENIEIVCPINSNGYFTDEVPPYAGILVKDADKQIMQDLKKQGSLFSQATIHHRYPFCWRSDTPLIYKAVSTWFVSVEKIKKELLEANAQIRWVPEHIKDGRFGKWLENARDWAISRNRYWGTPIPLWRSEDGDIIVIGSVAQLEELTGEKVTDLHRHFIDQLRFTKNGKLYKRVTEVFDCWFESGSMPYAQNHYPFENKEVFEQSFPADFIAEGLDQTRGWFYTLTVLSVALFKRPAFKNVIVNGIILAEDGQKMSKRLKNYPDPEIIMAQYGADAIRLYMLNSPVVKGDDLRFSKAGVEHVLRQVLIPYWNSFVFLSTYATIYKWTGDVIRSKTLIDRWILSMTQKLIRDVESGMEAYELTRAVEPITQFVDHLTNWYIRRCRNRFWSDVDSTDRREAFSTLYTVLLLLTKTAAPFIPFLTEAIYQELKTGDMPASVHLCDFPEYDPTLRDEVLEREMSAAQVAVRLGHSLRKAHMLKVRQPLAKALLITSNPDLLASLEQQKQLIADELNVKEVEFHADESKFVQFIAKPNFPVLGKKIGKLIPQAQKVIHSFDRAQLLALANGESIEVEIGGQKVFLEPADVQVSRKVKEGHAADNEGDLTVVLDTALSVDLLLEGIARELVNKINTLRRDQNLDVTDRITLSIQTTPRAIEAFKKHEAYILGDTLVTKVNFGTVEGAPIDLNGEVTVIAIEKA
jgi:isoleucyl-tRNA synthetase